MSVETKKPALPKVVVATTVALAFISFWRASAIVLCDLASSMFYAGGIVEQAIGPSAPWFVLGVMFFTFALRSVYMESCGMFVRGGVYVVVRDSMGRFVARLSVSALLFDYLLTGPISSVSAGHYLGGLLSEVAQKYFGLAINFNSSSFAVGFALFVTVYFWWNNIKGIHESSSKALRIMQITTVMVVLLIIWCLITLALRDHVTLPPAPFAENLVWGPHALGWLEGTFWPQLANVAIVIAIGHAFLSMSGFETLAQVYREIGYPKVKNLKLTGNVVCVYAIVATGVVTLLAALLIPDSVRPQYFDNLIGGLTNHLYGPEFLRLIFHGFVVLVGALILSAAVNTSIIGANSVMNRVAEDGVLLPWFRQPHRTYGTTYRIINTVALLQLITILVSGGDVYLLGEAYAFGVIWSFFMKSLGVLALRFQRHDQEYKTPLNIKIGRREIPLGLMIITFALFLVAIANLFTKQVATQFGLGFTVLLFALFTISEIINSQRRKHGPQALEEFNLDYEAEASIDSLSVGPGSSLLAVRDYTSLVHLKWLLENTTDLTREIVVMTVRPYSLGQGEYELAQDQYFSYREREVFTRVVTMAEKAGRTVKLLVLPAVRPIPAIVQTAERLKCATLILGASAVMSPEELARMVGLAWEHLPEPRHPMSLVIVGANGKILAKPLGPHVPVLSSDDLERVHSLWLFLSGKAGLGAQLHHSDVVSVAIKRMEQDLGQDKWIDVLGDVKIHIEKDGS